MKGGLDEAHCVDELLRLECFALKSEDSEVVEVYLSSLFTLSKP